MPKLQLNKETLKFIGNANAIAGGNFTDDCLSNAHACTWQTVGTTNTRFQSMQWCPSQGTTPDNCAYSNADGACTVVLETRVD